MAARMQKLDVDLEKCYENDLDRTLLSQNLRKWIKLGANVSNFPFSLGAIVHLGLGAIFVLYYCFFVSLNMFTTLNILAVIGGLTFLGGNSLLSNITARRGKRPAM